MNSPGHSVHAEPVEASYLFLGFALFLTFPARRTVFFLPWSFGCRCRLAALPFILVSPSPFGRSGAPDSLDRMVAMSFGTLAVQLIRRRETGKMVALHGGKYTTVPIEMVLAGRKRVDVPAFYDIEHYKPKIRDFMGVPMFLS